MAPPIAARMGIRTTAPIGGPIGKAKVKANSPLRNPTDPLPPRRPRPDLQPTPAVPPTPQTSVPRSPMTPNASSPKMSTPDQAPPPPGNAQAQGMGRYDPNAQVHPGDLGPGTVTGPTQRLGAPVSGGPAPAPAGSPIGSGGLAGMYSSSPDGGTDNMEGSTGGADGTGAPDSGPPAGGPVGGDPMQPGPNSALAAHIGQMFAQGKLNDTTDPRTGLASTFVDGKGGIAFQNDLQKQAFNALAPRLRQAVLNGKMNLGGALNRYQGFLNGTLHPQGA